MSRPMKVRLESAQNVDTYFIGDGFDSGHVTLITYPVKNGDSHAGKLLASTSYGDYGYFWSSMGEPLKQFVSDLVKEGSRSYLMNKLAGDRLMVFDFEGTIERAKRQILETRARGEMTKEEARDAFDDVCNIVDGGSDSSGHDTIEKLGDIEFFSHDYYELGAQKMDSDCEGFWEHIMKPLAAYLERENLTQAQAEQDQQHAESKGIQTFVRQWFNGRRGWFCVRADRHELYIPAQKTEAAA